MRAVLEGGGGGVSICPLFFDVGVELDGKVRECRPCKLFPRHLG